MSLPASKREAKRRVVRSSQDAVEDSEDVQTTRNPSTNSAFTKAWRNVSSGRPSRDLQDKTTQIQGQRAKQALASEAKLGSVRFGFGLSLVGCAGVVWSDIKLEPNQSHSTMGEQERRIDQNLIKSHQVIGLSN